MLSSMITQLGYELVDLGHVLDRPDAVKEALERGAEQCDLILTSGGVSAGDEDHVSKTLKAHGEISNWRIAIKPGRPLALAMFKGTPVVGLPGNPVAAWVCALRFGAPAMALIDRKSTRLNSSHVRISYAVFCLKNKNNYVRG